MADFLTNITDAVCADFGRPASLLRLLKTRSELRVELPTPPKNIDETSIVKWHDLNAAELPGWNASGVGFTAFRQEYAQLGSRVEIEVELDICDIDGLYASKSDLTAFQNLDQLVETNSREMIDELSEAKLAENLAHREIRILHGKGDYFARYSWDGRTFLINSGGSHHFAAARYLARRLNRRVPLRGRLCVLSLNSGPVAALCQEFEMFVISNENSISNAFHDAMRSFKSTWLWLPMPKPYEHTRAILLPRSEKRSMRVAKALRQAGLLDLGTYLTDLVSRQVER